MSIDVDKSVAEDLDKMFNRHLLEPGKWKPLTRAEVRLVLGTRLVFVEKPVVEEGAESKTAPTKETFVAEAPVTQKRRMTIFVGQQEIGTSKPATQKLTLTNEMSDGKNKAQEYLAEVIEIKKGVTVEIGSDGTVIKFTGADERRLDGSLGILIVHSEGKTNVGLATDALSFPVFRGKWSIDTVALFTDQGFSAVADKNPKVTLGQALTYKIIGGPKWNDTESERNFMRGQFDLSLSIGLKGFDVSSIQSIKAFDTRPFFGIGLSFRF